MASVITNYRKFEKPLVRVGISLKFVFWRVIEGVIVANMVTVCTWVWWYPIGVFLGEIVP